MKEIEKYMTPSEASFYWGIPRETLKHKISPSGMTEKKVVELQRMLDEGLIKFFYIRKESGRNGLLVVKPCMNGLVNLKNKGN